MRPQLHTNPIEPRPELVQPIRNAGVSEQPSGGLWTSTFHVTQGSAWVQSYLASLEATPELADSGRRLDSALGFRCWLLAPASSARVFVVNGYADLEDLGRRFGARDYELPPRLVRYLAIPGFDGRMKLVDWERVAERFDGVRVTEREGGADAPAQRVDHGSIREGPSAPSEILDGLEYPSKPERRLVPPCAEIERSGPAAERLAATGELVLRR